MPDETKPGDQKPGQPEAPKGIEDVLKELPKISVPNPIPPKPEVPKPSSPLIPPRPPYSLPPRPQTSSPSPPPPSSPKPPSTGPDKFQSFVRTMESDLEAAKKGLKPESKPFEIKPPPQAPPGPPITQPAVPKPPTQPLKLGPAEKAKPLDLPKPLMLPPKPPAPMIPPTRPSGPPGRGKGFPIKINPRLLIIVLAVIVAFAGVWFFMTRQQEPEIVFTPTPTATPRPIPKTLSELFPSSSQITISSTENFSTALNNKIKSLTLVAGNFTTLEVSDENQNIYTLSDYIARLNIDAPGLLDSLYPGDAAILLYGQREMFDDKGVLTFNQTPKAKIALIAKSVSPASTRNALNTWEITMTDDLKNLFGLDPKKATSEAFLDNIYSGQTVRYRNFPYADKSIDYSLVSLTRFNADYFILTNSRESIYSAIDLLQNQ